LACRGINENYSDISIFWIVFLAQLTSWRVALSQFLSRSPKISSGSCAKSRKSFETKSFETLWGLTSND
jgi:hypothetical protein